MKKALILLLALPCLFAACKKDPVRVIDSTCNPDLSLSKFADPTNFTNLYFPLESEKIYKYENQTADGLEKGEIVVTGRFWERKFVGCGFGNRVSGG